MPLHAEKSVNLRYGWVTVHSRMAQHIRYGRGFTNNLLEGEGADIYCRS